jgi:hypothetical protein
VRQQATPLEQPLEQLAREATLALRQQQAECARILVHLGLQFKLQQRHAAIAVCAPRHVVEMADTLEGSAIVAKVRFIESDERTAPAKPLQHRRIEVQAQFHAIVRRGNQQLLVGYGG